MVRYRVDRNRKEMEVAPTRQAVNWPAESARLHVNCSSPAFTQTSTLIKITFGNKTVGKLEM